MEHTRSPALMLGWWTINIPCYRLRDRGDFGVSAPKLVLSSSQPAKHCARKRKVADLGPRRPDRAANQRAAHPASTGYSDSRCAFGFELLHASTMHELFPSPCRSNSRPLLRANESRASALLMHSRLLMAGGDDLRGEAHSPSIISLYLAASFCAIGASGSR